MYGIRIGLGGAGSNAHTKHDAAALSGATAAKQLLSITPAVTASLADGASPPSASSLLLSRLATASSTPASMPSFDDGALFHVLPVNTSARPVPLSIADTAAEARRLERKQKKAERKKKVQEESKEQTDSQPEIDSAGPVPDLHSGPSEERQQIPPASQDTAAPVLKKKSKEHKRPLPDDASVTLRVCELRALLTSYGEAQVKAVCRALMASPLTANLPSLTAKQRAALQERLLIDHAGERIAQDALHSSAVVQRAVMDTVTLRTADGVGPPTA